MANPFESNYDNNCNSCGDKVYAGDDMYAHEGIFICENCAQLEDLICECGNYKKAEYESCYECHYV